jgi:hypothetical protein
MQAHRVRVIVPPPAASDALPTVVGECKQQVRCTVSPRSEANAAAHRREARVLRSEAREAFARRRPQVAVKCLRAADHAEARAQEWRRVEPPTPPPAGLDRAELESMTFDPAWLEPTPLHEAVAQALVVRRSPRGPLRVRVVRRRSHAPRRPRARAAARRGATRAGPDDDPDEPPGRVPTDPRPTLATCDEPRLVRRARAGPRPTHMLLIANTSTERTTRRRAGRAKTAGKGGGHGLAA